MTVGQVLAELGVHKMNKSTIPLSVVVGTDAYGDRREVWAEMWSDWRCTCGFRASFEPAIPDDMVQDWHDKAML